MLSYIHSQIQHYLPDQKQFLIGLSGGVDSVALLHLFKDLRFLHPITLRAIHIHHGLSLNADHWAEFCQALCHQWQIPLVVEKVSVEGKDGVEANARTARYCAVEQAILTNEVFVTAHHLDDQVETFFLALKRGSGIQGLAAMQAVSFRQNMTLFRPLLTIDKKQIIAYAQQHQLHWINDESNENTNYDRNFLRHQALPKFTDRWSHFSKMVARSSQHCAEQQQLIEELLTPELTKYQDIEKRTLNIQDFSHFSHAKQQQLIRLWLKQYHIPMPSLAQLEQILSLIFAAQDKNPQLTLGRWTLRRHHSFIYLTAKIEPLSFLSHPLQAQDTFHLPAQLGYIERNQQEITYTFSGKTDRLQLPEALKQKVVNIRLQQKGKVKCYGRSQREEMKKIWQQHRIPVWERDRTPIVFIDDLFIGILSIRNRKIDP
ncbi:tRNA(Ile)-lysidine synthase [Nicoletella semolina]|uniref:tRNA(Ile)-lysidine synthase n=1 Tax=Nicoletella semolina TaxID=271160 RepID=A0A4R2N6W6_9PAST|nr:tRNA lysidine(34) synthetase TilS [Nicoletella semolina]MDH2924714.1 tRNA(Ile)-lysidine synthase [Nicoletella semolina]TCP16662.1 tRNA(Ile)-lysidine synthase [Nicoletella semolina]